MPMFRTSVFGRIEDACDPTVWTSTGDVVEVDGERFVRMSYGTLLAVCDESWSPTAAEAKRRAADSLDAAAARLSAKAAVLRAEADATT
jgi:hypothetical protein